MQDLFDDLPTAETAYREAASHAHDLASWKPSHPVVYEAGRRIGFYKLRRRDTGGGKRAFEREFKKVCDAWRRGERFRREVIEPRIITGRERLSEQEKAQRQMIGQVRILELKAMLGR